MQLAQTYVHASRSHTSEIVTEATHANAEVVTEAMHATAEVVTDAVHGVWACMPHPLGAVAT